MKSFTKSQTATEYLIILAVVIVIALIVIGVLGGIPSIGGGVSESSAKAALSSAKVAVINYAISDQDIKLKIRNNNPESINVDEIEIGGIPCLSLNSFNLGPGSAKTVTCKDMNSYGTSKASLTISIDWTDLVNSASYTQASKNLALVGSVSEKYLVTLRANQYWNETLNGCFDEVDKSPTPNPICTCVDLDKVRDHLTWDYKLQNSIDFNRCKDLFDEDHTSTGNSGQGWDSIGGTYTGEFDGDDFVISNLFIDRTSSRNGLFGTLNSASISNLGLVSVDVTSTGTYTGGLTGYTDSSNAITNTYVHGNVTGSVNTGGFIGMTYGTTSTITNSFFRGSVVGTNSVGGLIGEEGYSNITNSYFEGSVYGNIGVGGLIGSSNYDKTDIVSSFSKGTISGVTNIGGLMGYDYYDLDITNSYSTSIITCRSGGCTTTGGLVGYEFAYSSQDATLTNSYWLNNSDDALVIAKGTYTEVTTGTCTSESDCKSKTGIN